MTNPVQPTCPCCPANVDVPRGCAAVPTIAQTGPCLGWSTVHGDCQHYGTEADGGLCEHCYIESK